MLSGKPSFRRNGRTWLFVVVLSFVFSACGTQRRYSSASNPTKPIPGKSSGFPDSGTGDSKAETASSTKKLQQKYSTLLGVAASEIDNMRLYRFIDEWINVPYKYGGRSKAGVDCSGISTVLMGEVYGRNLSGGSASIYRQTTPVSKEDLKEGDLVFFKINHSEISHMGVYLTNKKFIHASTQAGVIISDLDDPYYKKYYFKGGRLQ